MNRNALRTFLATRSFESSTKWRWWSASIATILVTAIAFGVALGSAWNAGLRPFWYADTAILFPVENWERLAYSAFLDMQIVIACLVLLLAKWGTISTCDALALKSRVPSKGSVSVFALVLASTLAASYALQYAFPDAYIEDTGAFIQDLRSNARGIVISVAVLGAPVSEELLFRGFLLPALAASRMGFLGAAILTSLAWSAIHWYSWPGSVDVFVTGLALSYLLWRTGSLWSCLALHAAHNAIAVIGAGMR